MAYNMFKYKFRVKLLGRFSMVLNVLDRADTLGPENKSVKLNLEK